MGTPIWRPDLATGITEIDRQHEDLLANVTLLRSAARTGQPRVAALLLTSLEHHAAEHFAAEERAMWQGGYPDLDAHWSLHLAFATELARRKAEYQASESPTDVLVDMGLWMDRWLEDHLTGADAAMARFLRGNGDRPEGPPPRSAVAGH